MAAFIAAALANIRRVDEQLWLLIGAAIPPSKQIGLMVNVRYRELGDFPKTGRQ